MGHRALVAYRRADRLFDLRYSHWGGQNLSLAAEISAESPLANGAIGADVLGDSIARERILPDFLDPCVHEMLYFVVPDREYAVTAYRVCWLEWGDGRDQGRGAIVETAVDDDRDVRTWFLATKTTLADVVEMGALSRRAAQAYLESRICENDGIVYTYGDPLETDSEYTPRPDSWLEDDSQRCGRNDENR
ncbi:hypothetical protein EA462_00225 [Natrarchaeobius halalkaliphilus]|uniref:Uncharacterized protein n=1 Tax=Natrarchaeobius halalkaliphilus TaxID=1679091 RepID=A0A3N6LVF5_9EURY|nr:DUF6735 family protein [Natrarchaeobius halalkaliphilus]RQG92697.1 hypothetical protein EA462_00225 [Natrarchaeobius halalkaliphilus]